MRLDFVADFVTQVEEMTVEVFAALQLVASQGHIHQHLIQARRVGDGHQHNLAAQQALAFQVRQALLEVPGHEHSG
ncbi:hypothetical protein D3C76_1612090 [compost metagenome]